MHSHRVSEFFRLNWSIDFSNTIGRWESHTCIRHPLLMITVLALAAVSSTACAYNLNVLTSMSTSVSETYTRLFKKERPDIHVNVLNKNTSNAFEEVLRGNPREFDIFWSSSPEVFTMLQANDKLPDNDVCDIAVAPAQAFAISGIGWAQRDGSTLPMPVHWNDLLRPVYRGRIGMARPSRSGVGHMIVENMLQIRGWNAGWTFLLELSVQLSTLTARSFGVIEGLTNDRFELGLTIDYLAQSSNEGMFFRYGRPTLIAPAQIGVLRGSKNVESACAFIKYILSETGQRALLDPAIARIPVNEKARESMLQHVPDMLHEMLDSNSTNYDSNLSSDRYWAVNSLFDTFVSDSLMERRDLWNRYHRIQNHADRDTLSEIKDLLTTMPVDERSNLRNPQEPSAFRTPGMTEQPEEHVVRLAEWRFLSEQQLVEAHRRIAALEERLK